MNLWELCGELMVSDVAELTRTLRKPVSSANGRGFGAEVRAGLRSRLRQVSEQIKADLDKTGQSIFIDENGNRYLIRREPSAP
jgi:hypothetical protein